MKTLMSWAATGQSTALVGCGSDDGDDEDEGDEESEVEQADGARGR
jgi:hypothetical protein